MDVDLADPVSSRKFSGFSCPWLQLRSSLWCRSQSLFGSTIAATATVVIFCGGVCVAMSCGGGFFTPGAAYDAVWDSVRPMTGNYTISYFQYPEFVGSVCMLK